MERAGEQMGLTLPALLGSLACSSLRCLTRTRCCWLVVVVLHLREVLLLDGSFLSCGAARGGVAAESGVACACASEFAHLSLHRRIRDERGGSNQLAAAGDGTGAGEVVAERLGGDGRDAALLCTQVTHDRLARVVMAARGVAHRILEQCLRQFACERDGGIHEVTLIDHLLVRISGDSGATEVRDHLLEKVRE